MIFTHAPLDEQTADELATALPMQLGIVEED